MATDHNFRIKNGLTVGAVEVIDSSGKLTADAFGTNSNEKIEDVVADMITGATHSNITVTYNDTNGTLAFSAAAQYGDSDVESYLDGGTSTPSFASLDVNGNATVSGYLNFDGGDQNGLLRIGGSNVIGKSNNWLYIDPNTSFSSGIYINNLVKVDGGKIGSYNEDLQLRTANTTALTLSNTDQSATFAAGASFGGNIVAASGHIQSYGAYFSHHLRVLNNAGDGWNEWATRSGGNYNLSVGTISSGAISTSANLDMNANDIVDVNQINGTGGSGWLDFNMDTDSVYPQSTSDNQTVLGSITHMNFVGDSNANGVGGIFYWGYGVNSADSGTFTQTMALDRSGNLTGTGNVQFATGNTTGKFAVMSSGVHASYDFYNNGTSYFNGGVIVDDHLQVTGGSAQLTVNGDANITGNLNVTGDINSVSVTDLDVTDKTITVGVGGTASANDGAGIIVDGASAKLTWNNTGSYWQMNKKLAFNDTPTTTNQGLGIIWTAFDKEGTNDSTDAASIVHTTNTGGHAGSVLLISSANDSGDGIAFSTHGSSYLKHNSSEIITAGNYGTFITSVASATNADTVDNLHASSFIRSDATDSASGEVTFSGNLISETGIFGASGNTAPDRRIWAVSTHYNNWGIFYNEGNPDYIEFKSSGNVKASIALDNGKIYSEGSNLVWHAGNDGSGSGLDADTVDGVQATSFVRRDGVDYGAVTIKANDADFIVQDTTDSITNFLWRTHSNNYLYIGTANAQPRTRYDLYTNGNNKYWHAGNDGSGSGLDADTLDGVNSSSFLRSDAADTASELITAQKGISSDGAGKMYAWRAVENTSSSGTVYQRIARISHSQSCRYTIELVGRSTSYGDGNYPSWGKLVGQHNNDNNSDLVFYDFKSGMNSDGSEVVTEIGQVNIDTTTTDIYVKLGSFAELSAFAHMSDGNITPYESNSSSSSAPSGYSAITKIEMWNSNTDGSGSGLDADTLDGQQLSAIARLDYDNSGEVRATNFKTLNGGNSYFYTSSGNLRGYIMASESVPHLRIATSGNESIGFYDGGPSGTENIRIAGNGDLELYTGDLAVQSNFKTVGSSGATAIGHGISNMDTTNLRLQVNGHTSIYGGNYLYFGITSNNHNSWKNRITGFNTSTLHINAQGLQVDNTGYASPASVWLKANNTEFSHKGNTIWHAGNDGSGSGLDADLLDGLDSNDYLRLDGGSPSPQAIPAAKIKRFYSNDAIDTASGSQSSLEVFQDSAQDDAFMTFHISGDYAAYFGLDGVSNDFVFGGWSKGAVKQRVFHDGYHPNADTLTTARTIAGTSFDGSANIDISYDNLTNKPSNIANSDTVDGLHASSFLRSDAEDSGTIINLNGGTADGANDATLYVTAGNNADWGLKIDSASGKTEYAATIRMPSSFNHALSIYKNGADHVRVDSTGIKISGTNYVWHGGNDGSGSGLDADLLDGQHGAVYLKSPSNVSGWQNSNRNFSVRTGGDAVGLHFEESDGTFGFQLYGDGSNYGFLDGEWASWDIKKATNGALHIDEGSGLNKVWTAGNDGSGSGLDADLLDGYNSAENGASTIHRLASNGYSQIQNWQNVGNAGLYSTTQNSAHFSPNQTTSYGSWRTSGSRGGYDGIVFDTGGDMAVMFDSNGSGGFYQQSGAGWTQYFHTGNSCTAFGSSTTSSSYEIYVHGAIYATGNVVAYSDRRIKENIVQIDGALEKVNNLVGVYYNKKDDESKQKEIGFIAQDVNEVVPELVTYAEDVDQYGVKYQNATALLVEAVKELTQQVNDLKQELEELKNA